MVFKGIGNGRSRRRHTTGESLTAQPTATAVLDSAHEGDIIPARSDSLEHLSDIREDEVDLAFEIADHLLTIGIDGRLTADMDHTIAGLDDGDVRKARRRLRRARDVELLDRCGHKLSPRMGG